MALLMLITVLGTAAIAAMEAKGARSNGDPYPAGQSPTAWFFIIALLWIVGYPAYLYKRKNYGLSNLLIGGTTVALVFTVSWFAMNSAIEEKKTEIRNDYQHLQEQLKSLGN